MFGYQGQPYDENRLAFDAELIENVIVKMKRGKAAGLDGITVIPVTWHISKVI